MTGLRDELERSGKKTSLLALVSVFFVLDAISDRAATGRLAADQLWLALFVTSVVAYALVLYLTRRTRLLDLKGR